MTGTTLSFAFFAKASASEWYQVTKSSSHSFQYSWNITAFPLLAITLKSRIKVGPITMDPKIRKMIETIYAHKKTSRPWTRGEPFPQVYYTWRDGSWQAQQPSAKQPSSVATTEGFSLISWNIDFMRPFTKERMQAALSFLQTYIEQIPRPTVIMLNEMLVSDLKIIQAQDWVRIGFNLTDVSSEFWESGYYGTCVLIPKSMPIKAVFRVHYDDTAMERDALFVDIPMSGKLVRICCTHLESLVADPPKRPNQLAQAAGFMHQADASLLGGDLNAIQPFDKSLHSDNGLKDGYLETGGVEDAESGMTWGQMAATTERNRFGLSRMDKLMFCGAIKIDHFESFGLDVVVDDKDVAKQMMDESGIEKPWVTDHLGVRGDFHVEMSASL